MPDSKTERLPNIHPGDVLLEDFLKPLGMTPYRLAKEIGISQTHVSEIIRHERSVTAATALRLSALFGTTPRFWLHLQAHYDIEEARLAMADQIAAIRRWPMEHPEPMETASDLGVKVAA